MKRLDVFVDAAFAFAITMLVISIDSVPATYPELIIALQGAPAFLLSFAAIMVFWLGHKSWSERYSDDGDWAGVVLSLLLVCAVMIYVYPLKVMASAFAQWISGGWLPSEFSLRDPREMVGIFRIYGVGFFVLAGTMALLYVRTRTRLRHQLRGDDMLRVDVDAAIWSLLALTGLASAAWATLLPTPVALFAGFAYFTLFPTTLLVSRRFERRHRGTGSESRSSMAADDGESRRQ